VVCWTTSSETTGYRRAKPRNVSTLVMPFRDIVATPQNIRDQIKVVHKMIDSLPPERREAIESEYLTLLNMLMPDGPPQDNWATFQIRKP
jgi:hypothetical protein